MKTLILLTIGVIDSIENNTASVEFHDFNDGSVQRALLNVDDFPCDAEETDFFIADNPKCDESRGSR